MKFIIASLIMGLTSVASAHELTPTYPELKPAVYDGILVADMVLFNRREDVNYYEIEVCDDNWNKIPFATSEKIVKMRYLERKRLYVYIKEADADKIRYICTRSKSLKGGGPTVIASNICSKIK